MVKKAHLNLRIFPITVCYFACVATLYSIGAFWGIFVTPTASNIIHWDAAWYNEVRLMGYIEESAQGRYASCAFYPLFPLVWRWSGLGPVGILFLNSAVFMFAVSWLLEHLKANLWHSLLFLTSPMLIFCFLPYTESLSFCLLSFFMIFFCRRSFAWAMFFLLLAGWTRPLIWQIIPVVLTWAILDFKQLKLQKFMPLLLLLCTTITSFLTINLYQYGETGVWNANIKAYGYWGGHLQVPTLPLRTFETELSGVWIRQIDYLAFAMCVLALFYLFWLVYKVYVGKRLLGSFQLLLAMSCAYLASLMLIRLLTMKGDFWSLSRYIFVNPFFAFFLLFSLRLTLSKFWSFLSFAFLFVSQMPFAQQAYSSNWTTFWWSDIEFLAITSNLGYLGSAKKYLYAVLILLGMLIQCYLLHCFLLDSEWVG